ncbi:MAG: anti-sigma factor [Actinomycetia bacterium]|nr:anti-sigma factor [Actinomycetes bacterium]
MNCQDVRAALLAGESSEPISIHIDGCVECRRYLDDVDSIHKNLANDSLWVEPPSGLEDSIVAAITGAETPIPSEAATQPSDGRSGSFSGRSLTLVFGSVAAAIVILAGVFAMLSRTPAPDWEAAMIDSDVTLSATAVVAGWNTDAGTRVVLEAGDLGPAPAGFVYQLWFSQGSKDVSAGTFSDPSYVELTVGVSRKDYPDVWIALQPIDAIADDAGPALLHTTGS